MEGQHEGCEQGRAAARPSAARSRKSSAIIELKHCLYCGSADGHNTSTCPKRRAEERQSVAAQERRLVSAARHRNKKIASLVTHLKYVKGRQRSAEYDTRARSRARAGAQMTLNMFLRLTAGKAVAYLQESGLLARVEGMQCPYAAQGRCGEGRVRGQHKYQASSTLGRLAAPSGTPLHTSPKTLCTTDASSATAGFWWTT